MSKVKSPKKGLKKGPGKGLSKSKGKKRSAGKKAEKKFSSKKTSRSKNPSKKRIKNPDPHAARESRKYDKPIASREFILGQLAEANVPQSGAELTAKLNIVDEEDIVALKRRLKAMVREGQIVLNRKGLYGLVDNMDLIKGKVSANAAGFGFLIPDEGGDDLFLSPGQMKAVFDGDSVLARVSGIDRRGRKEGKIVEVLERNTHEIVGRYYQESGVVFVKPDSKKIQQDILVGEKTKQTIGNGQFVVVKITQQPSYRSPAIGMIVQVLGEHMAPGMEIDVAIKSHSIPNSWSSELKQELKVLPVEVAEEDVANRIDLRHLDFVTIDGEDARDFDDAVYCEAKAKSEWTLYVAIADVANYIRQNTELDKEALKRGNSVYFPTRVIPMLPEEVSNGLCSLNPHVERLTMVCEMAIDAQGDVESYKFYEACIHSKARLTYTEVGAYLEEGVSSTNVEKVVENLRNLHAVFLLFENLRRQRGAIEFETIESRFIFNSDMKIEGVVPVVRNVAHKIIEEAMLNANVCAANFLQAHELPALYRVHETPAEDKINDLLAFLGPLGFRSSVKAADGITSMHYQEIVNFAKDRDDKEIINTILLRSMKQAIYSEECNIHFGLSYEAYTHFTSPIRRYPDLIVHRAIKYLVRSEAESKSVRRVAVASPLLKKEYLIENGSSLREIGTHTSLTERRADLASRDASDWLKCEFMLDKVGESFHGKISTVTAFGLFVLLDDYHIEGLVHITELKNDYYHFDEINHCLKAENSQSVYRLSDALEIEVLRVDLDERKIEFGLANAPAMGGVAKRTLKKRVKKLNKEKTKPRKEKSGKAQVKSKSSTAEIEHKTVKPKAKKKQQNGKKTAKKKPKAKKSNAKRSLDLYD